MGWALLGSLLVLIGMAGGAIGMEALDHRRHRRAYTTSMLLAVRHEDGSWWCSTADYPGFIAAARTRRRLLRRCRRALSDITGHPVRVYWYLVPEFVAPDAEDR